MKQGQFLRALGMLALAAMIPASCFGQAVNSAQIHGRVTDPSGAAIAGAQMTATQTSTGLVRTTVSGSDGSYSFPNLPVGPYQLDAQVSGFQNYVQKGIILQVGENPQIDLALKLGGVSVAVEVNANATMVETRETAVSEVIDQRRIVDLPLNGREATELVLLAGAATNPTLVNNDLLSTKNYGNGQLNGSVAISVAGGQENATNYLLDGGDNNDIFTNVNLPFPFPDAIQEFSVQTSTSTARYGVHAGAVVNIVTKSGTNQFHGDAFEFLRNGAVNARHFFADPTKPDDTLKRNQFGGTVGGPILRSKLFFFAGYQGTRNRQASPTTGVHVPTAAALAGDFSALEKFTDQPGGGCVARPRNADPNIPRRQLNPAFFDANDHLKSGITFDPAALKLAALVPTSMDPCGKLAIAIPTTGDESQGIGRVDWTRSEKHSLFARYFISDYQDPPVYDGKNILTATKAGQLSRSQSLTLGDTYILGPHLVNSLHATGTRLGIFRGSAPNLINFQTLGVNIPNPIPNSLVASVSNYFNVANGTATPGHFNRDLFQAADDVDLVRGKHQLTFGVDWIHSRVNELSNQITNGQFNFNGGATNNTSSNTKLNNGGDGLGDFLLGLVNTFNQGNPEQENWRQTYWGLYVHDSYKFRPNLTLNAGLRWEPYFPAQDNFHRGSHFDPAAYAAGTKSTFFPNAPPGLFFCGDPQTPCAYVNRHLPNFSPRVGLAWDPQGKGRLTIRAGYAVFYDNPEIFYFDRFADNSPFGSSITLTTPPGGFDNPYQGQTVPKFPTPFPTSANATFFPNGNYINIPLDLHPTYVQQWNLSVQQQLGGNWLFSATYLGNKTTHIWAGFEADAPVFIPGSDCKDPGIIHGAGTNPCSSSKGANEAARRVLTLQNAPAGAFFASIAQTNDGANASYNGLLLSANHRFSRSFSLLANYTYSHCISEYDFTGELAKGGRLITDPNNLTAERSNCGFDRRHVFNTSIVADGPKFANALANTFLGNWRLSTLVSYNSGSFFTIRSGGDSSLTGIGNDRADRVGDPNAGTCPDPSGGPAIPVRSVNCWFNTTAFVAPVTPGTFGTSARNAVEGPGFITVNVSLARTFKIKESFSLELRGEAFNILNHPNFLNPGVSGTSNVSANGNSVGSADFGKISATSDPRVLQLAVKLLF